MLCRNLLACLLLLITCASALRRIKLEKQLTLSSPKPQKQPFLIPVTKKKRTPQQQREFINFLQKSHANLKSSSFIQKNVHTIKLGEQTGAVSLPIKNNQNTQYTANIALGTKDQIYEVIFDTGSTAFFVDSTLCEEPDCVEHHRYDPLASATALTTDPLMVLEIEYGSGTVDGLLIAEDVYVGDLKVPQYIMFLIGAEDGVFENAFYDGIVGLGFPETDLTTGIQVVSLFDAMKDQLPQPYFSFYLRRNSEADSYVMFGGYNKDHMASDLIWHKVIDPDYWMLQLDNIYVGDNKMEFCQAYKCGVIIDSGTSVLSAPSVAILEMQSYMMDATCDQIKEFPSLWFEIEGHKYELAPNEYVVTVNENDELEFYDHTDDVIECSGTFDPMDMATTDGTLVFILGDNFFTRYYIVFDGDQNRIGMAPQKR